MTTRCVSGHTHSLCIDDGLISLLIDAPCYHGNHQRWRTASALVRSKIPIMHLLFVFIDQKFNC